MSINDNLSLNSYQLATEAILSDLLKNQNILLNSKIDEKSSDNKKLETGITANTPKEENSVKILSNDTKIESP